MTATISSIRVLIVGRETPLKRELRALFSSRGYDVDEATSGHGAVSALERVPPDVVVLDLDGELPDIKGLEVCRRFRKRSEVPIIVLSERDSDVEKVTVLDDGADDYIVKPFAEEELLARIRVVLRRTSGSQAPKTGQQRYGNLTLDFDYRCAWRGSEEVRLTPKEFELLAFFAGHPKRVLSRRMILTAIWGRGAAEHPEHLWVLVNQLRKKIEPDPNQPRYLINEPCVGYRFVSDPDDRH